MKLPQQSALMTVLCLLGANVQALPTTITDTYIGSDDHGWGDVIGNPGQFDIQSMDVELIGTSLYVSIDTNFAGLGDDGLFSSYTAGNTGIGYGDLFLSSAWMPSDSSPFYGDDSVTGTLWSYGFALDNQWGNGGSGTLYQLNGSSNADNALLSDDYLTGAIFRNGQEVGVNENGQTAVGTGSWSIDPGNSIDFMIDLAGTSLLNGTDIALHWGMTCGNDVIEGAYAIPAPEPGIALLMATGIVGAAGARRLRRRPSQTI